MIDLLLAENRGVVSRRQLLGAVSPAELRRLVRAEALTRVRHGWFAGPHPQPLVLRAVRAGGAVGCVSALALHGVWKVPGSTLHVRRSHDLAGRAVPAGVCECHPRPRLTAVDRSVDPLPVALATALRCVDADTAVQLMDSALHRGLLDRADLTGIVTGAPPACHVLLDRVNGAAESGTESLVRVRLQRRRVKLRIQVQILDIGRVDLLVGDRFVIEVDSRSHHTSEQNYAEDRKRDRRLAASGYLVVRLTYEDVMSGWDTVEPDILAIIRSGQHRWPRRRNR